MKKNLYCIYDSKAMVMTALNVNDRENSVKADLQRIVNSSEGGNLSKFPSDFDLICLGTFDDESGIIDSHVTTVCKLSSLVFPVSKKES